LRRGSQERGSLTSGAASPASVVSDSPAASTGCETNGASEENGINFLRAATHRRDGPPKWLIALEELPLACGDALAIEGVKAITRVSTHASGMFRAVSRWMPVSALSSHRANVAGRKP
jgi:hypothetical protein